MQRFSLSFLHLFTSPFNFSYVNISNKYRINTLLILASIRYYKKCINYNSSMTKTLTNESLDVFNKIPFPNLHLYTKMIKDYSKNYRLKDALQLFDEMPVRDTVAWNSIIKGSLDCNDLELAMKLFDEMPNRNVVSWTTMINGYMSFGLVDEAKVLFTEMPSRDIAVWNSMIYGYCSNGRIDDGFKVFEQMPRKNVISWTTMISGFDQSGRSYDALRLFKLMVGEGVEPTTNTFSCVVSGCAKLCDLDLGVQIHACVVKLGLPFDEFVASSFITLYANCKQLGNSCKVFNEKEHDSVVVWTSLLTGYSLNLMHDNALEVFSKMIKKGVFPNDSSFTSALNSCCGLVSLDSGKMVHAEAVKLGFEDNVFVGNSLITFYSKCGSILDAVKSFEGIKQKNLVSWNSIVVGCAQCGCGMQALALFAKMLRVRVKPDEVTFTGLLYAANHPRIFPKARRFFQYFSKYTSVGVNLKHYACMVDIICRQGNLDEAEEFMKNMPISSNPEVWLALLNACVIHSNLEIAERVSKCIVEQDPHCSAAYTLMSNLYASVGKWGDVTRIRSEMKIRYVAKQQGCSWLTEKKHRHGSQSHPVRIE